MDRKEKIREYLGDISNTDKYKYLLELLSNLIDRDKEKYQEKFENLGLSGECAADKLVQNFTAADVDDLLGSLIMKAVDTSNERMGKTSLTIDILEIKGSKRIEFDYEIKWANSILLSRGRGSEIEDVFMVARITSEYNGGKVSEDCTVSIKEIAEMDLVGICGSIRDVLTMILVFARPLIKKMMSYYEEVKSEKDLCSVEISYNNKMVGDEYLPNNIVKADDAREILRRVLKEEEDE